jgi:hypothetical protein
MEGNENNKPVFDAIYLQPCSLPGLTQLLDCVLPAPRLQELELL